MMLLGCCKDSSFFPPLSSRCFQITVCLWFIQDFYSSVRSKHPPKLESGHLWWVLERPHQSRSNFFRNCSWIEVKIKERKGLKSVLACCHVKSRGWRGNISQQTVLTRQTIQGCVCVCVETSTPYQMHFKEFKESFLISTMRTHQQHWKWTFSEKHLFCFGTTKGFNARGCEGKRLTRGRKEIATV